jgi:hypothetical protein
MPRDKLRQLEIELYNATRKFANIKNKEKGKKIFFAKMEDQAGNGTNSTIFRLESLGDVKTNGFVRAVYSVDSYDEDDWNIKIDGQSFYNQTINRRVVHKIVGEYKEFIIKEIYGIKERVEEFQINHNHNHHSNNHNISHYKNSH